MIKHIDFLRDFGLFIDFSGGDSSNVPAFNRYNLLYGWNYSGKTTLSRVFQALEKKSLPEGYSESSFRITLDDGTKLNSSDLSSPPAVRVFNRDFVNSNFRQEYTAPAVFIVGEESAELKARLVQLKERQARVIEIGEGFEKKQTVISEEIDRLGTDRARDVGQLLGDRNFRRPKLEQRIGEVRQNPASHLLDDETVKARLATLRSGDDLAPQPEISSSVPDFVEIAREVNLLLSQTASNRAIEQLTRNADIELWVRTGLKLHQESSICEFCKSPLSEERKEELRGHFSEAYEHLVSDLKRKAHEIKSLTFDFGLPDEARVIPDTRRSFAEAKKKLESGKEWVEQTRDQLAEALMEKQKSIENQTKWDGDLSRAHEGSEAIEAINNTIKEHNRMLSDMEQTKADAKSTLEKYYTALHFQESEIEKKEGEIACLNQRAERAEDLGKRIEENIRDIESQISQSAIGAEKLNELLKYLLAGNDIKVESVGESEFRFLRGGGAATNLSDGEKTALTLAYFLTSLEEDGASTEDTIVFVDDPVSSLDSNHIYAAYALITERLKGCRQVFVSTHNSEFFNLLKSRWLGKKGGNKEVSSAYWICREVRSDGTVQARIEDLPGLLRKFKSEYEFIFSKLYEFEKSGNPSEHEAYTAPNLLRKFLEAYLGFRKPDVRAWHEKLDLLFDSPEKCREVQKFADDASHLQTLGRILQHPAFVASSQKHVRDVLEALKMRDQEHYLSLDRVVNGGTT